MDSLIQDKENDEADACRICRGEATPEEPLFHPCKCSGSIKHVHQSCLLVWLGHTQRKHCELCKTPFRFTKLYHPHMPASVPWPVFLEQTAINAFKSILTWARWHLVACVWLIWVPWCMRTVWRGLFWLGDYSMNWPSGEMMAGSEQQGNLSSTTGPQISPLQTGLLESRSPGIDFAEVLLRRLTTWASIPTNDSTSGSAVWTVAKFVLDLLAFPATSSNLTAPALNVTKSRPSRLREPSLLSNSGLLSTLTKWPTINNVLIDILEGQIITMLVMVALILIFLIREWVVQQQPPLNLGAEFDVIQDPVQDPAADHRVEQDEQAEEEQTEEPAATDPFAHDAGQTVQPQPESSIDHDSVQRAESVVEGRPMRPMPKFRVNRPPLIQEPPEGHHEDDGISKPRTLGRSSSYPEPIRSHTSPRPGLPARDTTPGAADIRRALDEQSPGGSQEWPALIVFEDLWKRAGGQPGQVLRIIEQENRSEELAWLVRTMKSMEIERTRSVPEVTKPSVEKPSFVTEDGSTSSNGSWQVVDAPVNSDSREELTDAKLGQKLPWLSGDRSTSDGDPRIQRLILSETKKGKVKVHSQDEPIDENLSQEDSHENTAQSKCIAASQFSQLRANEVLLEHDAIASGSATSDARNEQGNDNAQAKQNRQSIDIEIPIETQAVSSSSSSKQALLVIDPLEIGTKPLLAQDKSEETRALSELLELPSELLEPPEPPSEPLENLPSPEGQSPPAHPPLEAPIQEAEHLRGMAAQENPEGLAERITQWLFGGLPLNQNVAIPGDNALNAAEEDDQPFQIDRAGPDDNLDLIGNQAVVQAAREAGINPIEAEAVEDAEDLEGIMELIGMQGPLAGLVQNGLFSIVLISITIFTGIFLPYVAGKLFLICLAHPLSLLVKMPLRLASTLADMIIDLSILFSGVAFYAIDLIIRTLCSPVRWAMPGLSGISQEPILGNTAWNYSTAAAEKLVNIFFVTGDVFVHSDIPVFSILAHESLIKVEQYASNMTSSFLMALQAIANRDADDTLTLGSMFSSLWNLLTSGVDLMLHYARRPTNAWLNMDTLSSLNPLRISLAIPPRTAPLDFNLAVWGTRDRIFAILLGYVFFALIGTTYLKIKSYLTDRESDKSSGLANEILQQAGGVSKVVLIISIEMIAFPLYCGLLLDCALLPLFDGATILSRIQFTLSSPITSLFVHWFVGTCYMFHFALFVSMCRRLMRHGVLYFIRDPNDPTFHPVRDVLERSLLTQLRKIAFSALVYGALVIVCLGSIVWGIHISFAGVFPIHWSSNEPVLEFPVDLLVYNFVMPIAVKFLRPSDGLHAMYDWWFRRCSRMLRLSHFLFDDLRDEELYDSQHPWSLFTSEDSRKPPDDGSQVMIRGGRYCRCPASDQVRIPKDARTFVELDEHDERTDGFPDNHQGLHGKDNTTFATIFIPPRFRTRIFAFSLLLWFFAAATGVGITIMPLLFGRFVFHHLTHAQLHMNDVYALAIGSILLGGPLYLLSKYRHLLLWLAPIPNAEAIIHAFTIDHFEQVLQKAFGHVVRGLRLVYFYTAFTLVLPMLMTLLMECYLIAPLHTYLSRHESSTPHHTIHFIQDWTLSVLCLKVATRLILWRPATRPAIALRALVAPPASSWSNPDVRLATRAFIFPATVLMLGLLLIPLGIGWLANTLWFYDRPEQSVLVYRYAYPAVAALGAGLMAQREMVKAVGMWRARIRDEVYLIGERLHNFGDRRAGNAPRLMVEG